MTKPTVPLAASPARASTARLLPACLHLIAPDIAQVEQRLQAEAASASSIVAGVLSHMLGGGGKRLRPALVILSGRASGTPCERLLEMAAAVEIVHVASMIHDDVVDAAQVRRGRPTVNVRWSTQVSVLAADYLIARLYGKLARSDGRYALGVLCRAVRRMCDGELAHLQIGLEGDLDEERYFSIVSDKTGALMSACCNIGAHTAGASPGRLEALQTYGERLGTAFQIVDDILDLTGEPSSLGKPTCNDLQTGHLTLPIIHVRRTGTPAVQAELRRLLRSAQPKNCARVVALLNRSGGIAYARAAARRFADQAREALGELPPSPERRALEDLTDYVVSRGESPA